VSVGDARSERVSTKGEGIASRKRPGPGNKTQKRKTKATKGQRKGKKVQGPKARRRRTGE
jgi:hypothetical protein